jgi:poly(A) polymerase
MIRLGKLLFENREENVLDFLRKVVANSPFAGKVFLAGGAVRDEIMGKSVKDIDLVVSMPDGGIAFAEWLTKKVGTYKQGANPVVFPRFGTAKFNLRGIKHNDVDLSGIDIETVMTRGEKYEKGSRKPEVVYADLEDDAYRRDLTVNSLFKDIVTGEIKDLTGRGIADIRAGIVRTPTDPDTTFKDDPLRMLRAVRFAVKYNWKMPLSLVKALKKNADMLKNISAERIQDEFNKILMTNNPDKGLKMLVYTGLNRYVLPELDETVGVTQNEYHKDDVFNHICEVVKNTAPDLKARLAAVFHDIAKPQTRSVGEDGRVHFYGHEDEGAEIAQIAMKRLKYPNDITDSVSKLVQNHMRMKGAGADGRAVSDKALRKFKADIGDDLDSMMHLMHADNISHSEVASMPNQIEILKHRMENLPMPKNSEKSQLPINGNDIMKTLGIKPGPVVRDLLAAVQDAWFGDPSISPEEAMGIVRKEYERLTGSVESDTDVLNKKIKNPETGNDILVKSALKYDDDHPAKKAAIKVIKTK